MTFARVNPGGWALFEILTSAQMNQLDINMTNALDGAAGGGYTPTAKLTLDGLTGPAFDNYTFEVVANPEGRASYFTNQAAMTFNTQPIVVIEGGGPRLRAGHGDPGLGLIVVGQTCSDGEGGTAGRFLGGLTVPEEGRGGLGLEVRGGQADVPTDYSGGHGIRVFGGSSSITSPATGSGGDAIQAFGGSSGPDGDGGHGGEFTAGATNSGTPGYGVVAKGASDSIGGTAGAKILLGDGFEPANIDNARYSAAVIGATDDEGDARALHCVYEGDAFGGANFMTIQGVTTGPQEVLRLAIETGTDGGAAGTPNEMLYFTALGSSAEYVTLISGDGIGEAPAIKVGVVQNSSNEVGVPLQLEKLDGSTKVPTEYFVGGQVVIEDGGITELNQTMLFASVGEGSGANIYDRVLTSHDSAAVFAWGKFVTDGVGGIDFKGTSINGEGYNIASIEFVGSVIRITFKTQCGPDFCAGFVQGSGTGFAYSSVTSAIVGTMDIVLFDHAGVNVDPTNSVVEFQFMAVAVPQGFIMFASGPTRSATF